MGNAKRAPKICTKVAAVAASYQHSNQILEPPRSSEPRPEWCWLLGGQLLKKRISGMYGPPRRAGRPPRVEPYFDSS